MGDVIRDPVTGTGATVDTEGHLHVFSVDTSVESHTNQFHGRAYTVLFDCAPAAGGDCFFYLKNNDDTDLVVEGLEYHASGADEIYIEIGNTGTAAGTSDSTVPANLNAGSGNTASVTCETVIGGGAVDITGVGSGGTEIARIHIVAAADNKEYNFPQDVVIPKNQTFTMWAVGGDVILRGAVHFNFHDEV